MKGASEWQAHTAVLGQLAAQYGGAYPPVENQVLSRYTDKEVISATSRHRGVQQAARQRARERAEEGQGHARGHQKGDGGGREAGG